MEGESMLEREDIADEGGELTGGSRLGVAMAVDERLSGLFVYLSVSYFAGRFHAIET